MTTTPTQQPSNLLDYLPAIYQTDPFIGQFLLAFEKILLGNTNDSVPLPELQNQRQFPNQGLEETVAGLATYFDPLNTPDDFLDWLASWTALSLREDIDRQTQKKFVANIIKYYQFRGTKANLEELLQIFVRAKPTVRETGVSEVQVGVREGSIIGKNMYLGGGAPHFFTVTIALAEELKGKPQDLKRQLEIANALIQLEKPAHTNYQLIPIYPGTIQIGNQESSVLGVNTILGNMPDNTKPQN